MVFYLHSFLEVSDFYPIFILIMFLDRVRVGTINRLQETCFPTLCGIWLIRGRSMFGTSPSEGAVFVEF